MALRDTQFRVPIYSIATTDTATRKRIQSWFTQASEILLRKVSKWFNEALDSMKVIVLRDFSYLTNSRAVLIKVQRALEVLEEAHHN